MCALALEPHATQAMIASVNEDQMPRATHDYSDRCFRGCGRTAVVIDGPGRYCACCWMIFTV